MDGNVDVFPLRNDREEGEDADSDGSKKGDDNEDGNWRKRTSSKQNQSTITAFHQVVEFIQFSWESILSVLFVSCVFVLGSFIVAISQEISSFAINCHTEATNIGTVFIGHGIGAILGSLSGSWVYRHPLLRREIALGGSLVCNGIIACLFPQITSIIVLHILYFLCGISTGLVDTGATILIHSLMKEKASPWMIAIQFAFNFGGAIGILIEYLFVLNDQILMEWIGGMSTGIGMIVMCIPLFWKKGISHPTLQLPQEEEQPQIESEVIETIEGEGGGKNGTDSNEKGVNKIELVKTSFTSSHFIETSTIAPFTIITTQKGEEKTDFSLEILPPLSLLTSSTNEQTTSATVQSDYYLSDSCLGLLILCIIGSGTTATAYLQPFAEQQTATNNNGNDDTNHLTMIIQTTNLQICITWFTMAAGILFSLILRHFLFPSNDSLPFLFTIFILLAMIGTLLILVTTLQHPHQESETMIWTGMIFFGFFSKPCVGFAFQWLILVTKANETSFAIAYIGLNAGSGIIPYLTTVLWDYGVGSNALFIVLSSCLMLSIPLFFLSSYLSVICHLPPREPS